MKSLRFLLCLNQKLDKQHVIYDLQGFCWSWRGGWRCIGQIHTLSQNGISVCSEVLGKCNGCMKNNFHAVSCWFYIHIICYYIHRWYWGRMVSFRKHWSMIQCMLDLADRVKVYVLGEAQAFGIKEKWEEVLSNRRFSKIHHGALIGTMIEVLSTLGTMIWISSFSLRGCDEEIQCLSFLIILDCQ